MSNLVLLTSQKIAQILFPNDTSFNDEKVVKYLTKKSSINDDKNQCYSHEPHWELSKKEVKNVFHYEESNLEKTIMENQRYPHGLR